MFEKYCPTCESFTNHTETIEGSRIKTTITTCQSCGRNKHDTEQYGVHYQDIRTESDFYKWASSYDPSNIEIEFTDQFMYVYTFGNFKKQLNLQVFDKAELLSICEELGIK